MSSRTALRRMFMGITVVFVLWCCGPVLAEIPGRTHRAVVHVPRAAMPAMIGGVMLTSCFWWRIATQLQSQALALRKQNEVLRQRIDSSPLPVAATHIPTASGPETAANQLAADPLDSERVRGGVSLDVPQDSQTQVNYPLLLLTVHDIGRRLSANLDLEALFPAIVSVARDTLRCGHCEVFLIDHSGQARLLRWRSTRDDSRPALSSDSGLAGWVMKHRQILTARQVHEDPRIRELMEEGTAVPAAIAPLISGGDALGVLIVDEGDSSSLTFVRLLHILSNFAALAIRNGLLFRQVERLARHDGLTGLLNHATFHQQLESLWDGAAAARGASQESMTLLIGDIDHFKRLNDKYGHQAGDHVLRQVARVWQAILPSEAILGRYGGEEFICALPGSVAGGAEGLAELLRLAIASAPLQFRDQRLQVTSSFGVAARRHARESLHDVIRRADAALYSAKARGRNQAVRCAQDTPETCCSAGADAECHM